MPPSRRIVLTDEDLTAPPPAPQHAPPGQPAFPSVSGIRPAPGTVVGPAAGSILSSTLATSVIASLVAILPAWAAFKLVQADASTDLTGAVALMIGGFGLVFGAIYAAWGDIVSQVWEKALRAALIGGAIGAIAGAMSGALAQEIYRSIVEGLLRDIVTEVDSPEELRDRLQGSVELYLARLLAWAIFGIAIGAAVGAVQRSPRRLVNGLIGGAIGGAVGGLVFHAIVIHEAMSEGLSQLVGLAAVGLGIGLSIGLVEVARRQAWLRVVGGGMAGKEFILANAITNVGASPKCQVTLVKDQAIQPFHFRIDEQGARRQIVAYDGAGVLVNGTSVASHWRRTGDTIQVGATALAYAERSATP